MRLGALLALSAAVAACNRVTAEPVSGIERADALWGGGGDFCARTPRGLECWSSSETAPAESAPVRVEGITGVREVALVIEGACALADGGVHCFRVGERSAIRQDELVAPTRVIEFGAFNSFFCALDKEGVACWHPNRAAQRIPELGKPRALLRSVDGSSACGVEGKKVSCFDIDPTSRRLRSTFVLDGIAEPRAIFATTGTVAVLDGTTVKMAHVSRISVGNPFAVENPLDVDVKHLPVTQANVEAKPVGGLGEVSALAHHSIWPVALDETGVASLDSGTGGATVNRWASEHPPDALFSGHYQAFFTRSGDVLYERGAHDGKRIERPVKGIGRPEEVAPTIYWTCIRDAGGRVACIKSPRA